MKWESLDIAGAGTIDNKYVDRMVPCQAPKCSDYFYQLEGRKYRYCPRCIKKEWC